MTDTTGSEDDYEWYADSNQVYLTNVTDAVILAAFDGSNNLTDLRGWPIADIKIWPLPALLPLETADSISPLAKDAGTNIDQLVVDFDQSTDECRTGVYAVPPKLDTTGTVTLSLAWYSASVAAGNVIWDFRHNSGTATDVDPDVALTTVAAAASKVAEVAGRVRVTVWTETVSNLGWVVGDQVDFELCRDANAGGDTFAADARAKLFMLEVPVTP